MELLLATGGWQLASCTSFNHDRISIYFYLFLIMAGIWQPDFFNTVMICMIIHYAARPDIVQMGGPKDFNLNNLR